jgi:hypothetical protein
MQQDTAEVEAESPERIRARALDRLERIVLDPKTPTRQVLQASKTIARLLEQGRPRVEEQEEQSP